jgi:hypothetical protein
LVQAKKKLLGYSVQNKEQTQPCLCSRWLSTPACRSYDATAASATAGGLFAPGGLTVGRTRRVAIAASVNMESSVHLVIIQGEVGSREERKASIPFPTATYREPSTLKCRSCACRCRHGRRRLRSGRPFSRPERKCRPRPARSQRADSAEHAHVPLLRRDCRCRHGRRWLCAGRPPATANRGSLCQQREQSKLWLLSECQQESSCTAYATAARGSGDRGGSCSPGGWGMKKAGTRDPVRRRARPPSPPNPRRTQLSPE